MHPADAAKLGLSPGDRVALRLPGGTLEVDLQVAENMAPGVLVLPRHRQLDWRLAPDYQVSAGLSRPRQGGSLMSAWTLRNHLIAHQAPGGAGGPAAPGRLPDLRGAPAPGVFAVAPGPQPGRAPGLAATHRRRGEIADQGRFHPRRGRPGHLPLCPGRGGGHGAAHLRRDPLRPGLDLSTARRSPG